MVGSSFSFGLLFGHDAEPGGEKVCLWFNRLGKVVHHFRMSKADN